MWMSWMEMGFGLGIREVEGGLLHFYGVRFSLFDSVLNPDYVYVTRFVGPSKGKIEPSVTERTLCLL